MITFLACIRFGRSKINFMVFIKVRTIIIMSNSWFTFFHLFPISQILQRHVFSVNACAFHEYPNPVKDAVYFHFFSYCCEVLEQESFVCMCSSTLVIELLGILFGLLQCFPRLSLNKWILSCRYSTLFSTLRSPTAYRKQKAF